MNAQKLDGQSFSALEAPAGDDFAAIGSFHAREKSMLSLTLIFFGLKCAFHTR